MSLDIYLTLPDALFADDPVAPRIFIREGGSTKEITRAEWDARFPEREPVTVTEESRETHVYHANITHNLTRMATEAGLYESLWRPDENRLTHARDLIELLRAGLRRLREAPLTFQQFNPSNGWGTYEGLCTFVVNYLAACEAHPEAEVSVSR